MVVESSTNLNGLLIGFYNGAKVAIAMQEMLFLKISGVHTPYLSSLLSHVLISCFIALHRLHLIMRSIQVISSFQFSQYFNNNVLILSHSH